MHQGNQKTVHHKGDSYVIFAPFLGRSPFTALIRRIVVASRDGVQRQTDIFYKKCERGDSVVSGWKISKFGEGGAVLSTVESVVTDAEINLPLDPSEFTIDFPAGTYVDNLAGPQDYIVRSDGSRRFIASSENDKSYEELLNSP